MSDEKEKIAESLRDIGASGSRDMREVWDVLNRASDRKRERAV